MYFSSVPLSAEGVGHFLKRNLSFLMLLHIDTIVVVIIPTQAREPLFQSLYNFWEIKSLLQRT